MGKKYTYEQVKEIFKEKGYELLSEEYINNRAYLTCMDKDGYKYETRLENILAGRKLTMVGNGNKWSIYNINKYVKIIKDTSKLLSAEFINQNEPLDWICEHGHIFHTNWNNFYTKGFRCKVCGYEKAKLTFLQCAEMVNKRDGYTLIDMFRRKADNGNKTVYLKVKHDCGHIYDVPHQEFNNRGCQPCSYVLNGLKRRTPFADIKKSVEDDTNFEYVLLDDKFDKDGRRRIKIKHERCGRIKWMDFASWNQGKRCHRCAISDMAKIKDDVLIKRVEVETDNEFNLVDIISKIRDDNGRNERYLKIKHNKCDHEFIKSIGAWNNIKNRKCPKCSNMMSVSYLHAVISILFDKYFENVEFEKDLGFRGNKGGKSKYDLFVPNYNGVDTIFEFQSRFHDGKEEFDSRKKQFAIEDGYRFIAIDHRDVEVLDVVQEYFPLLNSIPEWVDEELQRFKKLNVTRLFEESNAS